MFIVDFFSRNTDDIILLILGVVIGLLIDYIVKLFKLVFKHVSSFIKFIIRRIQGKYTLNELIKLKKIPKDKLTKRQKKALDKCHEEIKNALKDIDFNSMVNSITQTINEINKYHKM